MLIFSSKEDLVDKVLEHVADGFSRTSFTVWDKDNKDEDLKKTRMEFGSTTKITSTNLMQTYQKFFP